MMSKVDVTGANQADVYKWLTLQSRNCVQNAPVTWNFCKFLINEDGSWHAFKSPSTSPLHSSIVSWITSQASVEENSNAFSDIHLYYTDDNQLHISLSTNTNQNISVSLYGVSGMMVSQLFQGIVHTKEEIVYNTSTLSKGIYIINFESSNQRISRKIIIQ